MSHKQRKQEENDEDKHVTEGETKNSQVSEKLKAEHQKDENNIEEKLESTGISEEQDESPEPEDYAYNRFYIDWNNNEHIY